jgi:hypothetical protein
MRVVVFRVASKRVNFDVSDLATSELTGSSESKDDCRWNENNPSLRICGVAIHR